MERSHARQGLLGLPSLHDSSVPITRFCIPQWDAQNSPHLNAARQPAAPYTIVSRERLWCDSRKSSRESRMIDQDE